MARLTPHSVRKDHDVLLKQVPRDTLNYILDRAARDRRTMTSEILFILDQWVVRQRQQDQIDERLRTEVDE